MRCCMQTPPTLSADVEAWDHITNHRTGTAGDAATDRWLIEALRAAGAEPTLVSYPFERVDVNACSIALDGREYDAVPMYDSLPAGAAPITGTLGIDITTHPFTPYDQHPLTRQQQPCEVPTLRQERKPRLHPLPEPRLSSGGRPRWLEPRLRRKL